MADLSTDRDVLLNRLADEFAARYRRGERPSIQEYVEKHPDLADEIHEFFPALAEIEQAKADGVDIEPAVAAPAGPLQQLGDFRILRQIGQGGMGVVYEAEQISLGRHVALKVLSRKILLDERQKRRFEREAKAAAKLHHTNIVPVYGVGEHEGLPFYVMQFIQGLGLDQVMEELRRLQSGGAVGHDSNLPSPQAIRASQAQLLRDSKSGLAPAGASKPHRTHERLPVGDGPRLGERLDVSAAAVANSLLTGEFRRAPDYTADEKAAGSPEVQCIATVLPRPASQVKLSQSSSHSLSSVTLPGHASTSHGSGARRSTYWQSVAQVGTQVADALDYAHNQGVLHRDVKPSNLLLDTQGTVWVTDFGLAKADDQENLTQSGDLLGTIRYMPPEAFDGKSDRRSDVYGLGLTLYELLALRPAFDEHDRQRLIKQVTTVEPTPLDRLNPTIPRDLVTVVHKAIDHESSRRYATAADLAADLRRFLADEPILARRPSVREQVVRWARHHPGVARSLAAIGLLLVFATLVSIVAAGRFRRIASENAQLAALREGERIKAVTARQEAEQARDEARRRGEAERWERYRANIAAATSALWVQNAPAARRNLHAAPEQYRNWEWRYLNSQLDGARTVISGHRDAVGNVTFSSDGHWVASASADKRVVVWDAATGREVAVLCEHVHTIKDMRFSPAGNLLAALCSVDPEQALLHVWRATATPDLLCFVLPGDPGRLDWSPDGKFVSASMFQSGVGDDLRGRLWIWDSSTGEKVITMPAGGDNAAVSFRPGGRHVVRNWGARARVWDLEMHREFLELMGGNRTLLCLAYSPDGSRIAGGYAYSDNRVWLWDANTGVPIAEMRGHANAVIDVSFSPDGTRLASCSLDQTVRLWNGKTGEEIATMRGHAGPVRQLAFTPNGVHLISASTDATLRMWDGVSGEFVAVLRGHERAVMDVDIDPNGRTIASASDDHTIRLWDTALIGQSGVLRGHTSFVYDVAVSQDGMQIASAAWDSTVCLWDLATGRTQGTLQDRDKVKIIGSVAFHPDGRRLVSVNRDHRVTIWDLATQKQIQEIRTPTGGWTGDARAAFNHAGTLLAVGSSAGIVHLFEPDSGEQLAALAVCPNELQEEMRNARDVCFSPNDELLAIAVYDRTVRIWDVATRTELRVLAGHTYPVYAVTFNSDGRLLATADKGGTVRIWDGLTFEPVATLPHRGVVHGLSFSPDDTRLATACGDNSIRLWDLVTWQEVAELRGHELYVHAVAWSRDGLQLISGSGDATLRIWQSVSPQARFQSQKLDE